MINPLIIAPQFLKASSANGQLERHFFSRLSQGEFNPTVICEDEKDLKQPTGDRLNIIRIRSNKFVFFLSRTFRHTPWPHILNVPDQFYACWGKYAFKRALKEAKEKGFDYLHTICLPTSSHVIGRLLKKETGLPWVAQFYDPWLGNPFRLLSKNTIVSNYDIRLEREVAEHADVIIHPCQTMVELWEKKYGETVKGKLFCLPFGTELPSSQKLKTKVCNEKLVVSHIGNFAQNRNAETFLKALIHLFRLYPADRDRIVVNFVGNCTKEDIQFINSNRLDNIIEVTGKVSEEECYNYFNRSDLFLIVDISCSPNLFYPSKLIKYFFYKKPILGITTEDSVVANELIKTGNYSFGYYNYKGIAEFLHKAINEYESIDTFDRNYYKQFELNSVLDNYSKLVKKLVEKQ